jgi:hypothetical protein
MAPPALLDSGLVMQSDLDTALPAIFGAEPRDDKGVLDLQIAYEETPDPCRALQDPSTGNFCYVCPWVQCPCVQCLGCVPNCRHVPALRYCCNP